MSSWPFSVLGLEADASERDIKRAYARKLKAVHPEDDPTGFQALREAYEAALSGHWTDAPPEEAAPPEFEPVADDRAPHAPVRTLVPASPSADEELWELRDELLHRLHDPAATNAERLAALDAVLASPALENVGRMAEVEAWVGALIAEHPGLADPLIAPAIRRFGWDRDRRWDMPWFAATVLARRDAVVFSRRLNDPSDRLHAGYRLLQKPPGGKLSVFLQSSKVRPVLRLIDNEPGLWPEFEYEVIEQWRQSLNALPFFAPESWGNAWRLIFLIFWVGFIVYQCSNAGKEEAVLPREKATAYAAEDCRRAARAAKLTPEADILCDAVRRRAMKHLGVKGDKALILMRRKDWPTARTLWDKVLERSPNDARALYGRGLSHRAMDPGKGAPDIERALALHPAVAQDFAAYGFAKPVDVKPRLDGPPSPILTRLAEATYMRPVWTAKPGPAEMSLHYPLRAARQELKGRVVLNCAVTREGALTDCVVLSETPTDTGFADAALALAPSFRVSPPEQAASPGNEPRVKVALNFELEGETV